MTIGKLKFLPLEWNKILFFYSPTNRLLVNLDDCWKDGFSGCGQETGTARPVAAWMMSWSEYTPDATGPFNNSIIFKLNVYEFWMTTEYGPAGTEVFEPPATDRRAFTLSSLRLYFIAQSISFNHTPVIILAVKLWSLSTLF